MRPLKTKGFWKILRVSSRYSMRMEHEERRSFFLHWRGVIRECIFFLSIDWTGGKELFRFPLIIRISRHFIVFLYFPKFLLIIFCGNSLNGLS
jgi:hypothetical protein